MLVLAETTQQLTLRRAAKFGVEFKEPGKRPELRHVVRKEKALEQAAARAPAGGINTGFDLYSEVRSLEALPQPFSDKEVDVAPTGCAGCCFTSLSSALDQQFCFPVSCFPVSQDANWDLRREWR